MNLNGTELELDLCDMEVAGRYDSAITAFRASQINIDESMTASDVIKTIGDEVYPLVDNIFGPGTAVKVLGETYNMRTCFVALDTILGEEETQARELNAWAEKFMKARSQ